MPEGRMIKKVISESKKLGTLKTDSARLLYSWLIPWLDVEGRHSADPEIIKGHIFPKIHSMTIRKIERLIQELNDGRLIILYFANGEMCLQFKKTIQKIDKAREAKSIIPPPDRGKIIPTQENSRVGRENSSTSKDKLIKVNSIKLKEEEQKSNITAEQALQINKELQTVKDLSVKKCALLIPYIRKLSIEFPDVDFVYEIKKKVAWWIDNPLTKKSNVHLQLRNWFIISQKGFDEAKKQHRVGKDDGHKKTKYPLDFIAGVYAELHKQGKDGHKYADLLFALSDKEASEKAAKYKDSPAELIKFLEAKK